MAVELLICYPLLAATSVFMSAFFIFFPLSSTRFNWERWINVMRKTDTIKILTFVPDSGQVGRGSRVVNDPSDRWAGSHVG